MMSQRPNPSRNPGPARPGGSRPKAPPTHGSSRFEPPPDPAGGVWAQLGGAQRLLLSLGLLLTLAVLAWHAAQYWFLTDDSYISFRYSRNMANGFGLVFNPGHEPVEGYSNFLYVIVLAAFSALGIAPERMANVLSGIGTLALFGTVAWFSLRRALDDARHVWVAVLPVALLAITRSIAVWSSSGLETRWFEALLVGGTLRLVVELEAQLNGRSARPIAVWLFALATLTRPDGLLLSMSAFGATFLVLWRAGRLDLPRFVLRLLPFVVLVGG